MTPCMGSSEDENSCSIVSLWLPGDPELVPSLPKSTLYSCGYGSAPLFLTQRLISVKTGRLAVCFVWGLQEETKTMIQLIKFIREQLSLAMLVTSLLSSFLLRPHQLS